MMFKIASAASDISQALKVVLMPFTTLPMDRMFLLLFASRVCTVSA